MALRRGFGQSGTIKKESWGKGPRSFYMKQGEETTVVLVDDEFVEVVRHQMFLKGDGKGNGLRETCYHLDPGNAAHKDDAPQHCLGCNAQLRHDKIARKHQLYLTMIDERAFTIEGKTYKDMKRLLELGKDDGDVFERRRKSEGGLIGARFAVYRGRSQRSAKHGSEWKFLGFVYNKAGGEDPLQGLMRYFWNSPAIPALRENAGRLEGKQIDHREACQRLVTPYNYEELMGSYNAQNMAKFVAYHEMAVGGGQQSGGGGGGSSYVAPPMPGGMAPPPTMAAGAAPATQSHFPEHDQPQGQAAPPQQQAAPGGAPPWEPEAAPAQQQQQQQQQQYAPPAQPAAPQPAPAQQAYQPPPAQAPAAQAPAPAAAPPQQQQPAPAQAPYQAPPVPAQAQAQQPHVPDPAAAGGPGYAAPPSPFPSTPTPPSQQPAHAPPGPAPAGQPLANSYEFGGVPGQQAAPAAPAQGDDFGLA